MFFLDWLLPKLGYINLCLSTGFFFTCNDVRHSYTELEKIREEYMPTLVHTHFDGYDLAVNKVFFNGVKIVWHMHNHLSYVNHP